MTKIGKDGAMTGKRSSTATSGGCDPCGSGRRNRYFRDKRMHVADYELEQDYHIGRRRLVNRAMLGWGVTQGFAVSVKDRILTVGPGVGFDPFGRELIACDPARLAGADDLIWLERDNDDCGLQVVDPPREDDDDPPACDDSPEQRAAKDKESREQETKARGERAKEAERCETQTGVADCDNAAKRLYLLRAHYAEQQVDGIRIEDDCGDDRCEANHICETVIYSLERVECCPSGLPGCRCQVCAGEAACACEKKGESRDGCDEQRECEALERGPHRLLAQWSNPLGRHAPCEKGCLEHARFLAFDPDGGIPLACVTIGFHCDEAHVAEIVDEFSPRRLARPNEVLFDLIRGCDLVRIEDVSWREWLRGDCKIRFSDFAKMFIEPKSGRKSREFFPVETRFEITFSAPVAVKTLTADAFAVTLVQGALNEEIGQIVRMPIVGITVEGCRKDDPPDTTRSCTLQVHSYFYYGEIEGRTRSGFQQPTIVEIELRCEFMLDCNGQAITGGGRNVPSTGTVPGQHFLSIFTVIPDEQFEDDAKSRQEN